MTTTVSKLRKHLLAASCALATLAAPLPAWADDDAGVAQPEPVEQRDGATIYNAIYFTRFAPKNALDMIEQIPGFSINSQDQGRGLGAANANVLINGERVASKSDGLYNQLNRINASRVERIEIVDGATLGIPGLSGQVANVITEGGGISGRFEYRMIFRPKYAEPSWGGGEVSVNGSTPRTEWSLAYTHGTGRGAAGGAGGTIYNPDGSLRESRDILIKFVGEFPQVSGNLKWDGPGSMVANVHGVYGWTISDFYNDETRMPVDGVGSFRDFQNRDRGHNYEIGGDVDFKLGPGRLKLIGLDRYSYDNIRSDSVLIHDDASPSDGNRFALQTGSGETIARAEYRWDMLGGNFELDAEAAYNRLDQSAQLYDLDPGGDFVQIPFPGGSGGVTEDRYESILTYSRSLGSKVSLVFGAGGEYSKLAQTGPGGLTRTFWRPKGSLTLSYAPQKGLDLSLKLNRKVGQLDFGDFLASVNLQQDNQNAGNAELVPTQSWEADFELKKLLGAWGSTTLKLYGRLYDDYIDIIPLPGGGESPGNIASASLFGATWTSTFTLDPIGFKGAKLDLMLDFDHPHIRDPLTGESRAFSGWNDRVINADFRHDIPHSDWAWGAGLNWIHALPYYRLQEVGIDHEGPIYTYAFIENKDVFGLTMRLQVFNLTNGRSLFHRTVYDGLRDRSPVLFVEDKNLSVQPIIRFQISGSF